jgi:uncharacterized protein YndB with AHSA1/START domain
MAANFIAKAYTTIDASVEQVWRALTDPSLIKAYLHGTEAKTDWQPGSEITFTGEQDGKTFIDKGNVLQILPQKMLQYTYYSSASGLEDLPENYFNVTYELQERANETELYVKCENLPNEEARVRAEESWQQVLSNIKAVLERQTVASHNAR